MTFSAGSQWKRWDLHIHTPESVLNMQYGFDGSEEIEEYGGDLWEKYVHKIESANPEVAVIGITDYCSIDGYEKVLQYKNAGRLTNIELILANVEFRIMPVTERNNAVNMHCVFSDELSTSEIRRFLEELKYEYGGQHFRCRRDELIELGRRYKPNLVNENDCYREGVNQFKVDLNTIRSLKQDIRYKDKVFIILSNNTPDGASGLRDSSTGSYREQLYRCADFIFSGNDGDRKYFLGIGVDSKEEVIRKCGSLKACIHGSDAHDFRKLFLPDMDRNCWIKSETSFNGLRQLIFEPDTRVKIQKDEPEITKNIYSIKRFMMDATCINSELSLDEVNIQLNKNLTAIIGGKGSGKTAMIDLIANCYSEHDRSRHYDSKNRATTSNVDANSFVQRIERDCPELKVSVEFLDGETLFSKKITEQHFFESGQIRYLPQGKIETVAGNTEALHKDIQQLIFSHIAKNNDDEYRNYNEIGNRISQTNKEIAALLAEINMLLAESSSSIGAELERQLYIKKGELKDKEVKLHGFANLLSQQEEALAIETAAEIRDLESKIEKARQYIITSQNLIESLGFQEIEINKKITEINEKNFDKDMKTIRIIEYNLLTESITFNKNYAALRKQTLEDEKEKQVRKVEAFSGKQSEHAELIKERDSIDKAIMDIKGRMADFQLKQKTYRTKVLDLQAKYEELLFFYKSQKNSYDRIIEAFKLSDVDILSSIEFKAEITFDEKLFTELAEDLFDGRKQPFDFIDKALKNISGVIKNDLPLELNLEEGIEALFRKNKTFFDYYKWLTQDMCRLDTKVFFNGTELSKLSVGQKGAVILKLYLADGDYPIILDQPEDNLDNRFISEELITTFRKAKEKRQIIIATHNANLVVNSDAEQIIVADFIHNKISYKTGAIETTEIRREVASLLEGGEEAFKQRESKYGFSRP